MRAVLEIDLELGLGPYEDVKGLKRRVLAFSPDVVRGVRAGLLSTPPVSATDLTALSESLLSGIDGRCWLCTGRRRRRTTQRG